MGLERGPASTILFPYLPLDKGRGSSWSVCLRLSLVESPPLSKFQSSVFTSLPHVQLFWDTEVTQAGLRTDTGTAGRDRRKVLSPKAVW